MINKNKDQTSQPTGTSKMNQQDLRQLQQESAYATALLRSLQFSGVKFLRYFTVDLYNNVRCKVKPVDQLLLQSNISLEHQLSIAEVCYGGLRYSADVMTAGTGLDARNVLTIQPDLSSFRNLPYAPKSALVMGDLVNQYTGEQSPLCTRSLLRQVVQDAKEYYNIQFAVGVELEFCLMSSPNDFADRSMFANSTSLNEQEDLLADLYDQLKQQYIPVETIHSESGPGQVEVVLQYSKDPLQLADSVVLAQETIRAVSKKYNYKALFLPKYDMMKAGNGMHVHMSILDATTGQPVFSGGTNGGLSSKGSAFVEGLLQHLPGLMGLTMPTVNSFRRVGPGCWTGSRVGWALEDKECGVRVCSDLASREWNHVEVKLVDSSCNIYLALAGLLSSGLDGVVNELDLRPSLDEQKGPDETLPSPLPANIMGALEALEDDAHLMKLMRPAMSQAYLAVCRYDAEGSASSGTTLQDEVDAAYHRS